MVLQVAIFLDLDIWKIAAMLVSSQLKQTRVYQEFPEKRKIAGKLKSISRLLAILSQLSRASPNL
jgi:hypothetical protein